jgi:hypothetical protein
VREAAVASLSQLLPQLHFSRPYYGLLEETLLALAQDPVPAIHAATCQRLLPAFLGWARGSDLVVSSPPPPFPPPPLSPPCMRPRLGTSCTAAQSQAACRDGCRGEQSRCLELSLPGAADADAADSQRRRVHRVCLGIKSFLRGLAALPPRLQATSLLPKLMSLLSAATGGDSCGGGGSGSGSVGGSSCGGGSCGGGQAGLERPPAGVARCSGSGALGQCEQVSHLLRLYTLLLPAVQQLALSTCPMWAFEGAAAASAAAAAEEADAEASEAGSSGPPPAGLNEPHIWLSADGGAGVPDDCRPVKTEEVRCWLGCTAGPLAGWLAIQRR